MMMWSAEGKREDSRVATGVVCSQIKKDVTAAIPLITARAGGEHDVGRQPRGADIVVCSDNGRQLGQCRRRLKLSVLMQRKYLI